MTEIELCEAIAAFVVGELQQISWEGTDGTYSQHAPKAIIGFYPPKRSTQDDDNPYVFVAPQTGTTTSYNEQTSTIVIYIGARSESLSGYSFLFSALERVRHALLSQQGNVIKKDALTYQMQFPLSWEYDVEQPYPYWGIKITTNWAMPVVQQSDPDSFL